MNTGHRGYSQTLQTVFCKRVMKRPVESVLDWRALKYKKDEKMCILILNKGKFESDFFILTKTNHAADNI